MQNIRHTTQFSPRYNLFSKIQKKKIRSGADTGFFPRGGGDSTRVRKKSGDPKNFWHIL